MYRYRIDIEKVTLKHHYSEYCSRLAGTIHHRCCELKLGQACSRAELGLFDNYNATLYIVYLELNDLTH